MEWVAHSLDDLPFVAKSFLESLGHNKVVVFDGQMGAGKTTFITAVLCCTLSLLKNCEKKSPVFFFFV